MKSMFLCNIEQPNIDQAIEFLSSTVKNGNEGDWKKLLWVMSFLKGTINDVLTLQVDDTDPLTWFIDVALEVHVDMKIHNVAVFTMGKVVICSSSTKQKVKFTKLHRLIVDWCGI